MYQFAKKERLCNRIDIENLFSKGQSFLIYPFSVKYIVKTNYSSSKVQVLLLSPKRYQKLSVSRNRAKRLIRESYRLNKDVINKFAKDESCDLNIAVSLISKSLPDFKTVDESVRKILNRVILNTKSQIENDSQNNQ
ncbi:MAG: ribonuclease P protein component [Bacteroidales bacterium]|nr:ribonuclease P protein component [Bacteroidales bacterium]